MTELIVALDLPTPEAHGLANTLIREVGVSWFKIGPRTLLDSGATDLCVRVAEYANLMLDLKTYDTRDTVAATARRAFEFGARFLTVHATPAMLDAAMAEKTDSEWQKVLAVGPLTDGSGASISVDIEQLDGVICTVAFAAEAARHGLNKLLVCPGIRPFGSPPNNHIKAATPAEATAAGADYIVVGRPIFEAADPVAAARAIIDELAAARKVRD